MPTGFHDTKATHQRYCFALSSVHFATVPEPFVQCYFCTVLYIDDAALLQNVIIVSIFWWRGRLLTTQGNYCKPQHSDADEMDIHLLSAVLLHFIWLFILDLCFQVLACSHSQLVNKSLIASQHPWGDKTGLCQQQSCFQSRSNTISPERAMHACSGQHWRYCHTTGFTHALFSLQDPGCCSKQQINRFSLPDGMHWVVMCMKALAVHWMQGLTI